MAALRFVGNRRPRALPWLSLAMLCMALTCSARWVVARAAPAEHAASLACVPGPHQGNLTTSQDWCPQDNPHVVTFWSAVTSGVTLTLRPGVEVRFPVGGYLSVMGGATLLAEGTPAQPIVLTSGSASLLAGDWQYLDIQRNARARLAYCDLAYGGRTGSNLRIESSDVEVRNCRIHHGKDTGLYINGAGLTPLIQDSQIDHVSGHAIYQDWVNAAPVYRNLALTDNGTDGLVLQGGTIDRDLTFDGPGSLNGKPFYLNSTTLASGYTLAVTPGTTLRVAVAGRLTVNDRATLLAEGTVTRPITFTSWAATPQPGDWTFSLDGTVRLAHCDVSASGRGGWGGLEAAGNLWVRACRIHDNAGRAISASVDRLHLAYTQMDDNPQGLTNLTPAQPVVARNNWWGHASGPYHSKLNPSGQGLAVSDGVAFEPWLGTYNWLAPFRDLLHGTEWLQWAALGTDPGQAMTVDVLAFQAGQQHTLGTGLPRSGYLAWNTTLVADGIWELQALFRNGAGQVVGQVVRRVGVNNSPQVAYHSGWPSAVPSAAHCSHSIPCHRSWKGASQL